MAAGRGQERLTRGRLRDQGAGLEASSRGGVEPCMMGSTEETGMNQQRRGALGAVVGIALALVLVACGGDDEGGDGGDGSTKVEPTPVPTGPGDGDWRRAFQAGGVGVTCEMSFEEMTASGAPSITSGDTTIFVGFQQYGNNQDPVFRRFDGGQEVYCEHHEKESPDGRALGITWDGGPVAYVVYTIVGGGTAFDELAKGGWVDRYGDGGGSSAVAVIGEVETQFGTVQKATFVPAKREMGTKTNTLRPADAITVLQDGNLEMLGESAFAPLNPDKTVMCVPMTEYPSPFGGAEEGPNYLGRFTPDLAQVVCASTAGCSLVTTPCE